LPVNGVHGYTKTSLVDMNLTKTIINVTTLIYIMKLRKYF